jgi:hypothetical protein
MRRPFQMSVVAKQAGPRRDTPEINFRWRATKGD